jgi:hypothetical protein
VAVSGLEVASLAQAENPCPGCDDAHIRSVSTFVLWVLPYKYGLCGCREDEKKTEGRPGAQKRP